MRAILHRPGASHEPIAHNLCCDHWKKVTAKRDSEGSYRYGWEDAGRDVKRFDDYTFHITDDAPFVQASFSENAGRE